MHIRQLSPNDLDHYRQLRLFSIGESPASIAASYDEEAAVPREQLAQRLLSTPYQAIFGAFDGEALVALAGFRRERNAKLQHRGDIWGVYVAPAARGAGVSRALMTALLAHLRTLAGVVLVNLSVRADNDAARALYRRLGFRLTGVDTRSLCVDGVYHDEERMQLALDPVPTESETV